LLCALALSGCAGGILLNDVHSRLNPTRVAEVVSPASTEEVAEIVKRAGREGKAISISGSRHAMGGQQFGSGTLHISTAKLKAVLSLDSEKGLLRAQAGAEWPEIIAYLIESQRGREKQWAIVQKQTGADRLSLGGALSANAHGRGLRFRPIIQDVESFTLVDARGKILNVSRAENSELFRLAIGGYGLFGVITEVELRLMPRAKLKRVVEVVALEDLPGKVKERLAEGFLYGDFQYKTDEAAEDFMRVGVFSAYRPVSADTPIPEAQKRLTRQRWYDLLLLAHTDKSKAFETYSRYYLSTDGQVYWSDLHQASEYLDDYVEYLKKARPDLSAGSLMISELYVPRDRVADFVHGVIAESRKEPFGIVYGTMRLIERDDESYLAWAKKDYACVIFNLRVEHSKGGIRKAGRDFRRLIDLALALDGSFFPTYHRWATKDQWLKAFPQLPEFLKLKLKYDPEERFQSDWYRHLRRMSAR
jgi:FAD/FMN-containing dehydrogenase